MNTLLEQIVKDCGHYGDEFLCNGYKTYNNDVKIMKSK